MSRQRSSAALSDEAARWRRTLREEQEQHAATRSILRDASRLMLRAALHGRLEEPSDFEIYAGGLDALTDESGRLVWPRVAVMVDELLRARPHLAASNRRAAGPSALELLASGRRQDDASAHGAQGATAIGQGPADTDHTITEPPHD